MQSKKTMNVVSQMGVKENAKQHDLVNVSEIF